MSCTKKCENSFLEQPGGRNLLNLHPLTHHVPVLSHELIVGIRVHPVHALVHHVGLQHILTHHLVVHHVTAVHHLVGHHVTAVHVDVGHHVTAVHVDVRHVLAHHVTVH